MPAWTKIGPESTNVSLNKKCPQLFHANCDIVFSRRKGPVVGTELNENIGTVDSIG